MSNAENLKKYKELLDAGIITQEEFEKKKDEVLTGNVQQESLTVENGVDIPSKKPLNKPLLKKILSIAGIVALLVILFSVGYKIISHNQFAKKTEARAAALETEIASIMDDYGLSLYEVKYDEGSYDVYAVGFENLTKGQALSCLKELDDVSVEDPCGDDEIDFGVYTSVHPGLDVEYSYWRVSSWLASFRKSNGGSGTTPGLYCNQYGSECIYACEN